MRIPLLENYIVVLSPDGEELNCTPILDAFARSMFRDYLNGIRSDNRWDHMHANAIDIVSEGFDHRIEQRQNFGNDARGPDRLEVL
ncbi:MAG: hypothetical protein IT427_09925 [Pirellulales bacterium]|nr:hypothetical protein [Pirellulales bacterium]